MARVHNNDDDKKQRDRIENFTMVAKAENLDEIIRNQGQV